MYFSICNELFQGWEWDRTCRFVAECGYEAVELAPFTFAEDVRQLGNEERKRIRETASGHGLRIVGLHWLLASPRGLSATSANAEVREATSKYLVALTEFCSDVGGNIMVFGSPAQRRIGDGESVDVALDRFVETLTPALDRAAELGIVICVEPLPAPEANFILTMAEAVRVLERLQHPAVRTILDVKSACADTAPIEELVAAYGPLIAHVHANDANRRGPGFGDTDFRPILAMLQQIGYGGAVSVEVFDYSPDPETIARESLAYLRSCLAEAG